MPMPDYKPQSHCCCAPHHTIRFDCLSGAIDKHSLLRHNGRFQAPTGLPSPATSTTNHITQCWPSIDQWHLTRPGDRGIIHLVCAESGLEPPPPPLYPSLPLSRNKTSQVRVGALARWHLFFPRGTFSRLGTACLDLPSPFLFPLISRIFLVGFVHHVRAERRYNRMPIDTRWA